MKPAYLLPAALAVLGLRPLPARAAQPDFESQVREASALAGRGHVMPARFWRPRELKGFVSGYRLSPATGQAEKCASHIVIKGTGNLYSITFADRNDYLLVEPNHFEPNGIFECNDPGNPYDFLNGQYPGCMFRRWREESPSSVVMEVKPAKLNRDGDLVWTADRWTVTERFAHEGSKLTNLRNYSDLQSECTYVKE